MASLRLAAFVLTTALGVAASAGTAPGALLDYDYDGAADIVVATQADVVAPTTPTASLRPHAVDARTGRRTPPGVVRLVSGYRIAAKGEGALSRLGSRLADETGEFRPFAGRGAASRLTNAQATDLANWLGFKSTGQRLRGQLIFRDGNRYIVQDIDAHSGGVWKMASSPRGLGSKSTRLGTYDEQLNRIGP